MPRRYRRTDRVDQLLKEEIARVVREDIKDPRIGFTTVMDVASSPDLRHARVFVSVLGEEAEKQATLAVLRQASGFVRARVGQAVTLKFLPEIHFVLDRTLEQAARIEALLDEALPEPDPAPDRGAEADADGEAKNAPGSDR